MKRHFQHANTLNTHFCTIQLFKHRSLYLQAELQPCRLELHQQKFRTWQAACKKASLLSVAPAPDSQQKQPAPPTLSQQSISKTMSGSIIRSRALLQEEMP